MSLYSVIRETGPGFLDGGIAAQPDVADHAAFMNGLAEEGLILFAGPLAGTETGRLRALLIISADGEDEIRHRLDDLVIDGSHGMPGRDASRAGAGGRSCARGCRGRCHREGSRRSRWR
jgi:uncharacterized protein YciI